MNALILAAGYGTRLQRDLENDSSGKYEQLKGLPKALLPIGGQALISRWVELLSPLERLKKVVVLSNDKYFGQFAQWKEKNNFAKVEVLSDGTKSNESRLGAIGSIQYAIRAGKLEEEPLLVIGGDTLLDVNFDMVEFLEKAETNCQLRAYVTAYKIGELETTKYGILETDSTGIVTGFKEKPAPEETTSRIACPCFYYFKSDVFVLISDFLREKRDAVLAERDATGLLLRYLYDKMEQYKFYNRIGEGAHGVVYLGQAVRTGEKVALKKIPISEKKLNAGLPKELIREIQAMRQTTRLPEIDYDDDYPEEEIRGAQHVLKLRDVFAAGSAVVLATDLMEGDLGDIIRSAERMRPEIAKTYARQMLEGVAYIHSKNILHRDLKPSNMLIDNKGQLKIGDFGQARIYEKECPMSHKVATRWYRAPELLYGAHRYDFGVDLWAVGCIIGELFLFSPLFPGQSDIEQLYIVVQTLGTPTDETWPGRKSLPDYAKIVFHETKGKDIGEILAKAPDYTADLVKSFLVYDSTQRLPAAESLRHHFFKESFMNSFPTARS
ncbi:Oidioi.mRNA.OKI2018_I69.chr2.g7313.t2.cds [Oikopleura dioica]|uniref:Cyclin-dependent kinase 20 n=1 Tax=Oikopleura dioica TaxID=34765 RepID=A0ABN7T5S6_OIKDI|nr:Oidioi.mRNA.OKI2018_I69.chr2.g7313.t2.cds [Oikopleura dioica]